MKDSTHLLQDLLWEDGLYHKKVRALTAKVKVSLRRQALQYFNSPVEKPSNQDIQIYPLVMRRIDGTLVMYWPSHPDKGINLLIEIYTPIKESSPSSFCNDSLQKIKL